MQRFEKSSIVRCEIDKLFEFHLDATNIDKITPKNITTEFLSEDFQAKEGLILELNTTKHFIKSHWKVKIKTLQRPNLLVDEALDSPFNAWIHEHHFTKLDDENCELKDMVLFKPPMGFWGAWLNPLIRLELENMFEYRHKITKRILEFE